jgi:mercuric ion transport protein
MVKKFIWICIIALAVVACKTKTDAPVATDSPANSDLIVNPQALVKLEVAVDGMSCTGCENTINTGVSGIAGVIEVKSSFQEGKTIVKFDSTQTSFEEISKAISEKGYTVKGYSVLPADTVSTPAVQ